MQVDDEIQALIDLHLGLDRQGPGDEVFSRRMLSLLPGLPEHPRIADLGCGSGAGTLLLAEWLRAPVTAVDLSGAFLKELTARAASRGVGHLVRTVEADMGNLDWPAASLDLLWSEGAAYILTFAGAMLAWRPLLAPGGLAVISEMGWFTTGAPAPAREFWTNAYPAMATEAANVECAVRSGFEVLGTHRLPTEAWWTSYYQPLLARIETVRQAAGPVMREVIRQTWIEIDLFRRYSGDYGYTFYLLRAA